MKKIKLIGLLIIIASCNSISASKHKELNQKEEYKKYFHDSGEKINRVVSHDGRHSMVVYTVARDSEIIKVTSIIWDGNIKLIHVEGYHYSAWYDLDRGNIKEFIKRQ